MFAIQMGLWTMSDKELAAVGIGAGIRHGEGTGLMFPVVSFIRKAVSRIATPGPGGVAALDHEVGDNAVESGIVIVAVFNQKDKIIHRFGSIGGEEFQYQIAAVGFQSRRILLFESIVMAGGVE